MRFAVSFRPRITQLARLKAIGGLRVISPGEATRLSIRLVLPKTRAGRLRNEGDREGGSCGL